MKSDQNNSIDSREQIAQSDLGLEQRQYYLNESKSTEAYRQFLRDLAMILANDTRMIETDVRETYEFEKKIAQVDRSVSSRVCRSFTFDFQFHWTTAEQRARQNDTIRTTIGNLSRVFNTSVIPSMCFFVFFL